MPSAPILSEEDVLARKCWKGCRMRVIKDPRFLLWSVFALAWIGSVITEQALFGDSVGCELSSGTSIFGEAGWSWFPLGRTCTWLIDGVTVVDHPSLTELLIPATLLAWLVTLLRVPGASTTPA